VVEVEVVPTTLGDYLIMLLVEVEVVLEELVLVGLAQALIEHLKSL
jgi:hypothetical protein